MNWQTLYRLAEARDYDAFERAVNTGVEVPVNAPLHERFVVLDACAAVDPAVRTAWYLRWPDGYPRLWLWQEEYAPAHLLARQLAASLSVGERLAWARHDCHDWQALIAFDEVTGARAKALYLLILIPNNPDAYAEWCRVWDALESDE